jgi:hypothetical protein
MWAPRKIASTPNMGKPRTLPRQLAMPMGFNTSPWEKSIHFEEAPWPTRLSQATSRLSKNAVGEGKPVCRRIGKATLPTTNRPPLALAATVRKILPAQAGVRAEASGGGSTLSLRCGFAASLGGCREPGRGLPLRMRILLVHVSQALTIAANASASSRGSFSPGERAGDMATAALKAKSWSSWAWRNSLRPRRDAWLLRAASVAVAGVNSGMENSYHYQQRVSSRGVARLVAMASEHTFLPQHALRTRLNDLKLVVGDCCRGNHSRPQNHRKRLFYRVF